MLSITVVSKINYFYFLSKLELLNNENFLIYRLLIEKSKDLFSTVYCRLRALFKI